MDRTVKKVQDYIEKEKLLETGDSVIVGLSGGSDSICLLSVMKELSECLSLKLTAVHVHHGIRGSEADRDEAFSGQICQTMEIPFMTYRYEVPALAKAAGIGEEEMGRICRREAFKAAAEETGAAAVALAHNRNDLAETLLFNLSRGAGLRGLCSMRPKKDGVIRPILCLEKKEILEYLSVHNLTYQTDSTNLTDQYTRNRIRHQILPALEEVVNPCAGMHLADTASYLVGVCDYMMEKGREITEYARQADGSFWLAENMEKVPAPVLEEAILQILFALAGRQKDLGSCHVRSILDLFTKQSGKRVDLPCSVRAIREFDGVRIVKWEESGQNFRGVELKIPGMTETPFGLFETKIFEYSGEKIQTNRYTKWFDYGTIKSGLFIRFRREKDYMLIGGGHRKKLRRILVDDRIPERERSSLPLIAMEDEILWMPGGRRTEGHKITNETVHILEIRYVPVLQKDQEENGDE